MTRPLHIEYADAFLLSAGMPSLEFEREARFAMAGKLFELGRLTSGRAAQLCGMERVEFLLSLPRIGISSVNLTQDDADDEIRFAQCP